MASLEYTNSAGDTANDPNSNRNWSWSHEINERLKYKVALMKCKMMGSPMPTRTTQPCPPLSAKPCLPSATAKSALFQHIPPEIRRIILIQAFGRRVIHFDLRLMFPQNEPREALAIHCPCVGDPSISLGRDTSKPLQWEWCVTICQRERLETNCIPTEHDFFDKWKRYSTPWLSRPQHLPVPGHIPSECLIGALGWIQTCRQAYIEGFEILYSTNQFRIDEEKLLPWLPNLLLSRQRAMIRSVQLSPMILLWPKHERPDDTDIPDSGYHSDLRSAALLLEALPKVLPHLQFLQITFGGHYELSNRQNVAESEYYEWLLLVSEEVFDLVDVTVIKLRQSRLSHCRIYIPSNLFDVRITIEQLHTRTSFWRALPGQFETDTQSHLGKELDRHLLEGYWICRGEYEDRY
ncbi:hypothetical protein BDV06DRAFT_178101 [Aspergillus oleicola]